MNLFLPAFGLRLAGLRVFAPHGLGGTLGALGSDQPCHGTIGANLQQT